MDEGFRGKNVLITGGLGFIGSTLASRLVDLGAEVLLVDSLVPQYGGNIFNVDGFSDRVRINVSDVRDRHSLNHLVQGQDYVFNLAGQTSHLDSMDDPLTDLEINCRAQLTLLETCRENNPNAKIVFASTRQIYGKPSKLPVDENHKLEPVDVNGINKLAGEMYHLLYSNVYELNATVLRLTNTYGPRMRIKDSRQTFLGVWIRLILEGKPFEVWEGQQLRDFSYVDDVVSAFLMAAANEVTNGKVFNVGGNGVISLTDLAKLMVSVNGGGEFVIRSFPTERKRIDIGDYFADDSRIRNCLGWEPRVSLRDGLARTLDYFRKNLRSYT